MREGAAASPRRTPLAQLRTQLRDTHRPDSLRQLAADLRGDPRAGSRALLQRVETRLAAHAREETRLRQLFARRAALQRAGASPIAGVDEVGVGPLAGPVVAAAVILPERISLPTLWGLDDSKRLRRPARERIAREIHSQALAVAIAAVDPEEIDRINIYRASLEAMRRAVSALRPAPVHLLVDARHIPGLDTPQTALVHGDACDGSIAAASIVAKVYRDAAMRRFDDRYPGYGFARHVGYATAEHRRALRRLGPCPIHRLSTAPCAALIRPASGR